MPTPTPLAVPWYESETDFDTVMSMIPFNEGLVDPIPFSAWLDRTDKLVKEREDAGFTPYRIPIKPTPLKVWCDANDLQVCRKSITAYAMAQLGSQLTNK